jgi:formylglycine-generating enzyme required for sulfatase activity
MQEIAPPGAPGSVPGSAPVDAVSYPTPLYDSAYILAKGDDPNLPAVCMTPYAASQFARWVSAKTGRFYRLPTEAEWEYACRAGSKTAYCFGDDPESLDAYALFFDNSLNEDLGEIAPRPVASKKPNAFGLYDMHGNVAELVYDMYQPDYSALAKVVAAGTNPVVVWPADEYPRVLRGGSFQDDPADCRAARRMFTDEELKKQDPQIPQSIWWFTNAQHIGFRLVRPLDPGAPDQRDRWNQPECEEIQDILELQRSGSQ